MLVVTNDEERLLELFFMRIGCCCSDLLVVVVSEVWDGCKAELLLLLALARAQCIGTMVGSFENDLVFNTTTWQLTVDTRHQPRQENSLRI